MTATNDELVEVVTESIDRIRRSIGPVDSMSEVGPRRSIFMIVGVLESAMGMGRLPGLARACFEFAVKEMPIEGDPGVARLAEELIREWDSAVRPGRRPV